MDVKVSQPKGERAEVESSDYDRDEDDEDEMCEQEENCMQIRRHLK